MPSATVLAFPARTLAPAAWPTRDDLNDIVGVALTISRRWGATVERGGEAGPSVFVGRQSGGDGRWDARDAYSLFQDQAGRIALVDMEDPCDLFGTYDTLADALDAMKIHAADR